MYIPSDKSTVYNKIKDNEKSRPIELCNLKNAYTVPFISANNKKM